MFLPIEWQLVSDGILTAGTLSARLLAILMAAAVFYDEVRYRITKNARHPKGEMLFLSWFLLTIPVIISATIFIYYELVTIGRMDNYLSRASVLLIWMGLASGFSLRVASRSQTPWMVVVSSGAWLTVGTFMTVLAGDI